MRDLRTLIQASGFSGVSGQSFRNHVSGAATGVAMSDYFISGVVFTNPLDPPPTSYPDNTTYFATASLSVFGTMAGAILNRSTTAWQVSATETEDAGTGQSASLTSVAWSGGTAILGLNVRGAYTPGTPSTTANVYFRDYSYPSEPPDAATYPVRFAIVSGSVAASGSATMYVNIAFTPDMYAAGFNPSTNNASVLEDWRVRVDRIANPGQTIEVEWHTDSGFTSLYSTAMAFDIDSDVNTDVSYWLRYRNAGSTGSWTAYGGSGEVHWMDPRPDA